MRQLNPNTNSAPRRPRWAQWLPPQTVFFFLLCLSLLTAACTTGSGDDGGGDNGVAILSSGTIVPPAPVPLTADDLPDLGPAPEILNDVWLNTDEPVTIASQAGKVVLVEFWTFSCINCRRVIPYVKAWQERYAGDDFAVVSVHYPEFEFERNIDNVRTALDDLGITYPVAIDNDRLTWGAYNQRYWPTTYLVDKQGHIRYMKIGEGAYDRTEAAIVALMAEPG